MTVHAVDWSGGGDFAAPNAKIRYARWEANENGSTVTVMPQPCEGAFPNSICYSSLTL